MYIRTMAGAFLTFENKVLLLKRGMHKALAPGMWSCVGGHMEPQDNNSPYQTCYREITEETGITPADIEGLSLRYITVQHMPDEICTGYFFVGEITYELPLPQCDEGELHWVSLADLPGLPMSFFIREIINHRLANPDMNSVTLCAVNTKNDRCTWTKL